MAFSEYINFKWSDKTNEPLIWNLKSSSPLMMPYLCALSAHRARNWYSNMLRRQIRHCTEVRSNSFSSGQLITVVIVNPTDEKLLNVTSVHWAKPEQVKHAENETKPVLSSSLRTKLKSPEFDHAITTRAKSVKKFKVFQIVTKEKWISNYPLQTFLSTNTLLFLIILT